MNASLEDGNTAVSIARETLEAHVRGKAPAKRGDLAAVFSEKRGVFVTLNLAGAAQERLRGCIGFPYPVKELAEAIKEAAAMAATEDPRFPPVTERELGRIVVEVSILSVPQPLKATDRRDYPSKVAVGRDGLMVSNGWTSGLLLPQVATEFGMGPEEFLSQACMKAGLQPDAWLSPGVSVQTFQAAVFGERRPRGDPEPVTI